MRVSRRVAGLFVTMLAGCAGAPDGAVALPSWNDGASRTAFLDFVASTTTPGSPAFVPPRERIAVFDNDGTLWSEQPAYFQLFFAMDRIRALAAEHPEWKSQQPYAAAIDGDLEAVAGSGVKGLLQLVMASHGGMTSGEFDSVAREWIRTWRHPQTGRSCTEMVFQPMLEVLDHLRAHGFKTYIVSGGGVAFVRAFAEEVYGIPPEQVIGSLIETKFEMTAAGPVIRRLPKLEFIDDKEGKPVAIQRIIGRRPIAAFGNSDGDLQMLQWTAAGPGASFVALVHHTDGEREWAYDRKSHIGKLEVALEEAQAKGWTVVDMKRDWRVVYPGRVDR